MYNADPTLLDKFKTSLQTKSENTDPRPLVYITRNKTAITSQRYWEKQRITSTVGTRSSIAVRRPEGSLLGDMIFTAQVESGTAVIREAEPKMNLADMEWTQVATIPNVSELSIVFDGYMVMRDNIVEAYTTGDLPIVFYVDNATSLKCWNMNNDAEFTISDTAYNVASVRGLYSEAAGLDDGIWVFYTNASGELWEARVLNDEVAELTEITLKPSGVTGWEDVWATLTFDYRVALQLKGDDGNVHTLLSASRPGGFNNLEYLSLTGIRVDGKFGKEPPNLLNIDTVSVGGDYGKLLRLTFDGEVGNVSNTEITRLRLVNAYGEFIYPVGLTYGQNLSEVYLHFSNINNLIFPAQFECLGTFKMGSEHINFAAFTREIFLDGLKPIPSDFEYIGLTTIEVSGEVNAAFDGKAYHIDSRVGLGSIAVTGSLVPLVFNKAYYNSHVSLSGTITAAGTIIHVNDIPV